MRPTYNRKTSPKVIGGHVQRKNNHTKTARRGYVLDRERPSRGYVHVLSKKDIHNFVEIIPDWATISDGIETIFLAREDDYTDAYYRHYQNDGTGVISLCAWPKSLWIEHSDQYYQQHSWIFKVLGVHVERTVTERNVEAQVSTDESEIPPALVDTIWTCYFTERQAKAYMLMHVFLHELGHHVDKLRSKKHDIMVGGERFAENYANRRFHELWPSYINQFGLVR